jgi:type II secretory ATPase GspE/PulE/Tfp pilus assembly ATPase PilB-like protein
MDKEKLLRIVQSWNINKGPEYRGFRCANCQRYIARLGIFGLMTRDLNAKSICVKNVSENTIRKQN